MGFQDASLSHERFAWAVIQSLALGFLGWQLGLLLFLFLFELRLFLLLLLVLVLLAAFFSHRNSPFLMQVWSMEGEAAPRRPAR